MKKTKNEIEVKETLNPEMVYNFLKNEFPEMKTTIKESDQGNIITVHKSAFIGTDVILEEEKKMTFRKAVPILDKVASIPVLNLFVMPIIILVVALTSLVLSKTSTILKEEVIMVLDTEFG